MDDVFSIDSIPIDMITMKRASHSRRKFYELELQVCKHFYENIVYYMLYLAFK